MRIDTSAERPIAVFLFFFFKQKTAYEIGLGIPAEPLFRSPRQQEPYDQYHENSHAKHWDYHKTPLIGRQDRKSGSAGMPRPISYAVFCLKKKKKQMKAIGKDDRDERRRTRHRRARHANHR